jgi:hypothetical protein
MNARVVPASGNRRLVAGMADRAVADESVRATGEELVQCQHGGHVTCIGGSAELAGHQRYDSPVMVRRMRLTMWRRGQ